ncbi:hypothetical protein [Miltoncostaea oceani]|uniref:hypothetical protein n=1 Tax=Miltoncostaea oceani TaxID=2843216 RepID=UPI001C3C29C2|nr:hypothetical protein [Miltoncostaea oceani]
MPFLALIWSIAGALSLVLCLARADALWASTAAAMATMGILSSAGAGVPVQVLAGEVAFLAISYIHWRSVWSSDPPLAGG